MPRRPSARTALARLGVAATTALGICPMAPPSHECLPAIGFAAVAGLVASAGCGGKTPEVDTAEVTPARAQPEPAKPDAPSPAKDAPKE